MASTYVHASVYAHTQNIIFMSDNLQIALREVIRENGLSPQKLVQDWVIVERGIRTWLATGHLTRIVVEFFKPGASIASARWDIPISYSGSGLEDDLWLDKAYLRQLIAKSARPSADCSYRVILCTSSGAPDVEGFRDCAFLSTGTLAARSAGTVIATGTMLAGMTYWR